MSVDDYTMWDVLTDVEIYRLEVIERAISKGAHRVSALRDQVARLEEELMETQKYVEIAERELMMARQQLSDMEDEAKRRRAERKSPVGDK